MLAPHQAVISHVAILALFCAFNCALFNGHFTRWKPEYTGAVWILRQRFKAAFLRNIAHLIADFISYFSGALPDH
jgi:hypothetical protein